jgi:formylmethanofuran dehydrogenase subunit C
LDASAVRPDLFASLAAREISRLVLRHGRENVALGDFFDVAGERSDDVLVVGDLKRVKGLGAGMEGGSLRIEGSPGMHVGARMSDGIVCVEGDVDAWAGAEMRGGLLDVRGRAADSLGGAYAGSVRGMTNGLIIVRGGAGDRAGERMRRGTIAILGDAGRYAGGHMVAGTLVVGGSAGGGAGLGMKRGTIVIGGTVELLPTFRRACQYEPPFLGLLRSSLERRVVSLPWPAKPVPRYCGDFAELGRGEILLCGRS